MSAVARRARVLADTVLPRARLAMPVRHGVEAVLAELRALEPIDAHDESAIGEVGEMLLRLRDASPDS